MLKIIKKYESTPIFVSQEIFNRNFVAICEIKPVLTLNRPNYIVFSILNLSKYLMNEFHYKYTRTKYHNHSKLLFTETDSLVYEIEKNDVYEDFYEDKDLFDFSDYQQTHNFGILSIKKLLVK